MNKDIILQKLEAARQQLNEAMEMMKSETVVEPPETIIVSQPVEEPPTRSPEKRALIVGINKYDPALNCDLSGCVNDANNMKSILESRYGFTKIVMLTDFEATQKNILASLGDMIDGAIAGDQLVFTFSGHGSQVPDANGDETDSYDEILCPTDLNFDAPLSDDVLATYFKRVPDGAQLTFLSDSCHSGTVSRGLNLINKHQKRTMRYLQPPLSILEKLKGKKKANRIGQKAVVEAAQNIILFAGCKEDNYSYEGYFNNIVQGAFTWNFCKMCRQNPQRTWREAEDIVRNKLISYGYPQEPQLVTRAENFDLLLFGG